MTHHNSAEPHPEIWITYFKADGVIYQVHLSKEAAENCVEACKKLRLFKEGVELLVEGPISAIHRPIIQRLRAD